MLLPLAEQSREMRLEENKSGARDEPGYLCGGGPGERACVGEGGGEGRGEGGGEGRGRVRARAGTRERDESGEEERT